MCFEAVSHSSTNPALLWALSILDPCPPVTHKPFPCFTFPCFSSVQSHHLQDSNLKLHLPSLFSDSLYTKTHLPGSCLTCPGRGLTWHCPLSQIQCPKVNEIVWMDPRKRIIALDLETDAEIQCEPFSLAFSHIHFEMLFSHLAVAHFLRHRTRDFRALGRVIPGFSFAWFGCDCAALCCSSKFLTFAFSKEKLSAIQRRT